MGLFSSIGKLFKKVWGGIKKVFKTVMKPIAKFLGSDIGKILMLAVSVFTLGSALLAGAKGFMSGTGFIGKFVNGGKEFLNTLLGTEFATAGPGGAGAGATGAAGEAAGQIVAGETVSAGNVLVGAGEPAAAGGLLETAGTLPAGVPGGVPAAVPGGVPAAAQAVMAPGRMPSAETLAKAAGGAAKEPGWLSKAASAAMDFAKSPSGATIIGGAMEGYGRGQEIDAFYKEKRRVADMFANPNDPGMRFLRGHDFSVQTPQGLAGAPGRFAQAESQQTGRYTPTTPFRRPPVSVGG